MPRKMPAADLVVDAALARDLLRAQHPDLAALPIGPPINGWDNVLFPLGDDLLLRLPRREAAAPLIRHEQRRLPELAAGLPLPVPVPLRVGAPGPGYPWPWSVTALLPGRIAALADDLAPGPAARAAGDFLARLHRPAPEDAPVNPYRGIPLADRRRTMEENLALVEGMVDVPAVGAAWHTALTAAAWGGPPVWVHGDLHPANLLVADGRLSAVLDFGDLTSGDPATDLAVAWMLLPGPARAEFWTAYAAAADHPVDAALRTRARGWALSLGVTYLAHSADNPVMQAIGAATVSAVLADDDPETGTMI